MLRSLRKPRLASLGKRTVGSYQTVHQSVMLLRLMLTGFPSLDSWPSAPPGVSETKTKQRRLPGLLPSLCPDIGMLAFGACPLSPCLICTGTEGFSGTGRRQPLYANASSRLLEHELISQTSPRVR